MSMSYYACASEGCGEGVCDHSPYIVGCSCERIYCSERCASLKFKDLFIVDISKFKPELKEDKDFYDRTTCKYCRLDKAYSSELLDYLLESFGITREFIETEYLNKRRIDGKETEGRKES